MTQHTPGPWTLQYEGGQFCFLNGPDGHPVMRQRGGMMPTRHDARLIEHAPEMLALIQQMLNTLPGDRRWPIYMNDVVIDARALLAKIEGSK